MRHVGDLGNIVADANGVANIKMSDHLIQVRSILSFWTFHFFSKLDIVFFFLKINENVLLVKF